LFLDACKNRVDKDAKNVISLSGGLDSRAIAAALRSNNITCYAVTSPEPVWRPIVGNLSETDIAKELAKVLNIECEDYDIMIPKHTDLITLLRIKNGLIYLAHSFLPKFLQKIKDKHELTPVNFFTGHGGDIAFANLSFNVRDVESWARSILRVKGRLPICQVAKLTRLNETQIINELKNILRSYPEKDLSLKNAHFLFFENNAKFSFEIEDVNRFYFWSVAPFYSVPFFKYIFSCSDKDKEKLELYREFLFAISPVMASIKVSNWSCSIMSKKFKILQAILSLSFKHRKLRSFIKKVYDKRAYYYKKDDKIIECIREQLKDCRQISNLLTSSTIEEILDNSSSYDHDGVDNLFTITSFLEDTLCNKTTIPKYF
jgi:asparagine synthase (glutamine-hydrolysing)